MRIRLKTLNPVTSNNIPGEEIDEIKGDAAEPEEEYAHCSTTYGGNTAEYNPTCEGAA